MWHHRKWHTRLQADENWSGININKEKYCSFDKKIPLGILKALFTEFKSCVTKSKLNFVYICHWIQSKLLSRFPFLSRPFLSPWPVLSRCRGVSRCFGKSQSCNIWNLLTNLIEMHWQLSIFKVHLKKVHKHHPHHHNIINSFL